VIRYPVASNPDEHCILNTEHSSSPAQRLLGCIRIKRTEQRERRVFRPVLPTASLFLFANLCAAPAAECGPGEAAATALVRHVDLKVLVWYSGAHPLESFQYQVYDVRKGEYTPSVDSWIDLVRKNYPAYIVILREVDLRRERGETESLKVGSVIQRELLAAAAMDGIVMGAGPAKIGSGPSSAESRRPSPEAPGLNRSSYINPNPIPFPVPYPYPRPHP
jgi:hypothetical protein